MVPFTIIHTLYDDRNEKPPRIDIDLSVEHSAERRAANRVAKQRDLEQIFVKMISLAGESGTGSIMGNSFSWSTGPEAATRIGYRTDITITPSAAESIAQVTDRLGLLAEGFFGGTVFGPLLLPVLPFKSFALKGALLGLICPLVMILWFHDGFVGNPFLFLGSCVAAAVLSSYLLLQFTGSTVFTGMSGVQKELKMPYGLSCRNINFAHRC